MLSSGVNRWPLLGNCGKGKVGLWDAHRITCEAPPCLPVTCFLASRHGFDPAYWTSQENQLTPSGSPTSHALLSLVQRRLKDAIGEEHDVQMRTRCRVERLPSARAAGCVCHRHVIDWAFGRNQLRTLLQLMLQGFRFFYILFRKQEEVMKKLPEGVWEWLPAVSWSLVDP